MREMDTEVLDIVLLHFMTQPDCPQRYRGAMEALTRTRQGPRCGKLATDARAAIEYVFRLGTVYAVTIGTSRGDHLDENVRLVEELAPQ